MLLFLMTALATDHGIQRVYDREVECAYEVDPKPDPSTCSVQVRSVTPDDDRPTWAISVAPPGKLYVSYHMPDIDWGTVHSVRTPRAFEPILLSVGLKANEACEGELVEFAHLSSERGAVTHQACANPPWKGRGEVLLESHRKVPPQTWVPVWAHKPEDAALASDVKNWFFVQVYIAMDGARPATPPQHPYSSVDLLLGAVPAPLRPRRAPVVPEPPTVP